MSEIRVRIAPSPTGFLHVGTARTAVYNWLFARHQGGKFILRIEDTDLARSTQEMVEVILESLTWLGLEWDEGPFYQSERKEVYQNYARILLEKKKAYYCFCTPEELKARREEAQKSKLAWKYDRRCLKKSGEEIAELERSGKPKAIRLLVPQGKTAYHDIVYKDLSVENQTIDDLVLLRSDGTPTYNLACVVDDIEMNISHVIRGNDHIANTYKQIIIYNALDRVVPQFAHLPLILGADRAKISKRFQAVSVTDYQKQGFLPEAVVNFLALLGWAPKDEKEIFTGRELIERFVLEDVNQANPVFDLQKLEWMNGEYIRSHSDERVLELVSPLLEKENLVKKEDFSAKQQFLLKFISLLKERCTTLTDFAEKGVYFFTSDFNYEPKAAGKYFDSPQVADRLKLLAERLLILESFRKEELEQTLYKLAEELGIKASLLIHPARLATTGTSAGPPLFDLLGLLGKEEVNRRIQKAVGFILAGSSENSPT
ncbi:MAG: glutamate--tRNA ligase [candidate division Zixibacteria bacterium RBG_16_50_21]|nr:MAG: glutamate--tRNA ligase [candidate division Zixibacteria bacterium RBG_16_50_21]